MPTRPHGAVPRGDDRSPRVMTDVWRLRHRQAGPEVNRPPAGQAGHTPASARNSTLVRDRERSSEIELGACFIGNRLAECTAKHGLNPIQFGALAFPVKEGEPLMADNARGCAIGFCVCRAPPLLDRGRRESSSDRLSVGTFVTSPILGGRVRSRPNRPRCGGQPPSRGWGVRGRFRVRPAVHCSTPA